MKAIKCGKCKGYHESISEVRACCQPTLDGEISKAIPAPAVPLPATLKQLGFISKLRHERNVADHAPSLVGVDPVDRTHATEMIQTLLQIPFYGGFTATVDIPHEGRFTVIWPDQSWRTFRFWQDEWRSNRKQFTAISYLAGPDNSRNYVKCGDIADGSQQVHIWRKFHKDSKIREGLEFLLTHDVEALRMAGEMYSVRSQKCYRCGHALTVPTSVHRGLGPDCAELLGVA